MDIKKSASFDDEKYVNILDCYNDKSFVYSVLLIQSARYYNMLKYAFQLPIIITSSVLSVLNGSIFDENDKHLKIINVVFNITTALVLSINNVFKFETKANDFKNNGIKFQKLSHLIEGKVLEGNINQDFINNIINTYDNIVESIDDDPPQHICNRVRNTYKTLKHLPTPCNGIAKASPNITYTNSSLPVSPLRKLSICLSPLGGQSALNSSIENV